MSNFSYPLVFDLSCLYQPQNLTLLFFNISVRNMAKWSNNNRNKLNYSIQINVLFS